MKWLIKYKALIILLVICCAVYIALQFWSWNHFKSPNEFGDTAGWINGLFSAFAFASVIYAIFMQRDELELQREELKETRKELSAQKEEFKTQNDTLKRQRFENTFFNMLQLQQQITDNISYSYTYNKENFSWQTDASKSRFSEVKVECCGREVFRTAFEEAPHYKSEEEDYYGMRGLLAAEGLEGYENSFTPSYFDHYFRHLYRMIKFVATSQLITDKDRYEYVAMIRAQLSRYELVWIYYNCLSSYGREKFKPLIERFAILKNLRDELLIKGFITDIAYSPTAFGCAE